MADYIYLLENRLSGGQQAALNKVREIARAQGLTVFLVGGAVRDLTNGSPVRDLDVVVYGNALKLRKQIELAGGTILGEHAPTQTLYAEFPGGVWVEIGSTLSATYPRPGKPVFKPATILDDLRRRDFTANAMALSLNEGSYGLLMDPLNGVADIENRQLRLISPYGFIEEPSRMIRAVRLATRLGWAMDERTQSRYQTGKEEDYIAAMSDFHRGYETEEIFHEDEPLLILRKLEDEGWMNHLFPAITVAKANAAELEKLREVHLQLEMRGIHPDTAAANFPLLTAKLAPKDVADLKKSFARPGFVKEIESLDAEAKEFAAQWTAKSAATPSQAWKLILAARPEVVLWMAYSSKSSAVQNKLKAFLNDWPQARNRIPYALLLEMRITPDLPVYEELIEKLFMELMDGNLGTVEELKAYLEAYAPPAPPPVVSLRRPRAAKKDAKGAKARKKAQLAEADAELDEELRNMPQDEDAEEEDEEQETAPSVVKASVKTAPKSPAAPAKAAAAPAKAAPAKAAAPVKANAPAPAKTAVKSAAKPAPARNAPAAQQKTAAKKTVAPAPAKAPAKKVAARPAPKPAPKKAVKPAPAKKAALAKKPAAPAKKAAPVKKAVPPAKKAAAKPAPAKKATPSKKPVPVKAAPKKKR